MTADLENSLDDMVAAYDWLASFGCDDPTDWPFLLAGEPPNRPHVRGLARVLHVLQVEWQQTLWQQTLWQQALGWQG